MTTTDLSTNAYRLPLTSVPRRYDLRLAPNLDEARFDGDERIEIEVLEETDRIVLNAVELTVDRAEIHSGWASERSASDPVLELEVSFDETGETVTFRATELLRPGRYTLSCAFSGTLNDKLCGFYRSSFADADGSERTIATTQFEETDARRAFPCYDEPERKAVFGVTLDVPAGLFGVSNGPQISTTPLEGGASRVRFGDTIIMSSYLVAFVVGALEATEPIDVDGTAVRVVHVPGKSHLTAAALDCAAHALRFYTEYFGIAYPGDKLDLVAIPDFAAGAMENLGCVIFREAILLADPENTSRAELERLAEVVEHEIAHMWFGDLVTMRWWNGIWLNEAFATFMSLCCQDDYRPEWQTFVGFARGKGSALAVDGLHATRPIEFPVNHPDDAAAMFDVLTYEKGAGVLWMLEAYLGRETFRAGVRRYLHAHEYENTETTDLWDAIEKEVGDEPIREVMDSWIFQGGYPLVSVKALDGDQGGSVEVTQQPFSYRAASAGQTSAIGSSWRIPLIARGSGAARETKVLLGDEPARLELGGGVPILNSGGAGFYRTRHDASLLEEILDAMEVLGPSERYNLVADTWATALAGLGALDEFFAVVRRLRAEHDPYVWSVILGALGTLDLVASNDVRPALRAFVNKLVEPELERVGWVPAPDEDGQTPLLRSSLVAALGTIGEHEGVIAHARELFAHDVVDEPGLEANLASAVLGVVAAHATSAQFDALVERYRHPRSPMDELRYLNSLASVRDVGLAARVHDLCRSEVRSQNAPYVLGAMMRSRSVGPVTFSFVTGHYDELVERFPDNSIHRMLEGVTGLVELDDAGEPLYLRAAEEFCRAHVPGARGRLIEQSLERLEVNVAFAQMLRTSALAELLAT